MPRQLVAVAPRKAALVDYEEPEIGRHQIRVRVEYASPKHGSEVGVFRGEDPFAADHFDDDWWLFLSRKENIRTTHASGKIDSQWIVDSVVTFADAPGAYEEYVDRNTQKSIKLGIAFD